MQGVFVYSNCTFPTSWTGVLGVLYVLTCWKAGRGGTFLAIITSSYIPCRRFEICLLPRAYWYCLKFYPYSVHLINISKYLSFAYQRRAQTCTIIDCKILSPCYYLITKIPEFTVRVSKLRRTIYRRLLSIKIVDNRLPPGSPNILKFKEVLSFIRVSCIVDRDSVGRNLNAFPTLGVPKKRKLLKSLIVKIWMP